MKHTLFFAAVASLFCAAESRADIANFAGDTKGGPAFVRPTETGARSFFAVPYNVYQFNVATSGAFTFTLTAADPANYDTFLHLFVNAFNPADLSDPATNFLAGNDDSNLNDPTLGSALNNFTLNSGTTYFLVLDGFSPSDAGAYTASISGPGAITVVPEPSSFALLGIAGMALLFAARRRQQNARA